MSALTCHNGILFRWYGRCWQVVGSLAMLLAIQPAAASDAPAVRDTTLRVGTVRLESHDIFSENEIARATGLNRSLRRAMNALHVNTRPWVIKQELLFAQDDVFDPRKLAESARNLRSLGILNRIEIAPQDTASDGRVGVVVRSHEVWTLGMGFNFALASSGALRWNLSLTERNLLGRGLVLQGVIGDDLDARYGGVYLRQRRFLRTPVTFEVNYADRQDGFDRWVRLSAPFRAEAQTWGFSLLALERRYRARWYLSNAGPAGERSERWTSLYASLPIQSSMLDAEVVRRVSSPDEGRIWRLGFGMRILEMDHDLGDGLFTLSDGRRESLGFLAEPGQPLGRDRGTEVWPHLILASQGRRWIQTRFLMRYGNLEDVPLGALWELRIGPAGRSVGSTTGSRDRLRMTLGLNNWFRTGESFWLQRLSAFAYLADAADRSHKVEVLAGSFLRLGSSERPFTVKSFVEAIHGDRLRGDQASVLGLDRGLRTLDIDGMAGDRLLRWSTELGRTLPWVVLDIVQLGWGVTYSGGLARWRDEDRDLSGARHELGVGLRFGSIRSGTSDVARLDLTFDLNGHAGAVLTTGSRGFF